MHQPEANEFHTYVRLRRTARCALIGFAVVAAYLAFIMIRTSRSEQLSRLAIIPYLMLCALCVTAFWVLRALWRRARDARPEMSADDDGDNEPRPHIGLNGKVDPPSRW